MKKTLSIMLLASLTFAGCRNAEKQPADARMEQPVAKPVVYTSSYPLSYFAKRIAGDHIDLHFPAAQAGDPAAWTPPADTVVAMQGADLILLNGASYEGWLMNVSLADSLLVDTSVPYTLKLLPSGETFTHSHGDEGAHEHEGTAFTTWLDLSLAAAQASAVKSALIRIQPTRRELFEENFQVLAAELQELDSAFKGISAAAKGKHLAFSHPVYQYFQEAYGLEGSSLHWEPDTPLNQDMLHEIGHLQKDHNIQIMVWEGTPLPESVDLLKERGIESVVIDPMGGMRESGDFLEGMRKNLEALRQVLTPIE